MKSLQDLKLQIENLRSQGLTADEILIQLSLPYDIINTVSTTNQELLRQRAEAGVSDEEVRNEAEIIALLRQYGLEDNLPADKKEQYRSLQQAFKAESEKNPVDHTLLESLISQANSLIS